MTMIIMYNYTKLILIIIVLIICSAAAPTASPHINTTFSITSRSVSVSWTQIRCIQRNGPITNYTVEFQEVGRTLLLDVVVNRTFKLVDSLLTQTTPSELLESMMLALDPLM